MTMSSPYRAESSDHVSLLAHERAALRRVATLVAAGAAASELLAAVAQEVASVLNVTRVTIGRYDEDGYTTVLASLNDPDVPVGSRWPLEGPSLGAKTATVATSIVVDGLVWGVICVAAEDHVPLPPDTEERLERFTELLATAIAGAQSREALTELAKE